MRWLIPIVLAVVVLIAYRAIGDVFLFGYQLDLGSVGLTAQLHAYFLLHWTIFAMTAAILLTIGILRGMRFARWPAHFVRGWNRVPDALWVAGCMGVGLLAVITIRILIFGEAPVTDDESCYQFTAELLASGRLKVPSPPMKLFFDRAFMVNDGHMYSMYFTGWPAMLVPGVWFGIEGFVNAFYFALTIPGLFIAVRRLTKSTWAKLATLLYLTSPILFLAAATKLSNTSCFMMLTWCFAAFLRARDSDARWWHHAAFALLFSMAFFIRPATALGIGFPLLVLWGVDQVRRFRCRRAAALRACIAFFFPAVVMAGAFLTVNKLQTGSYAKVAYQRQFEYAHENGLRFSNWSRASHQGVDKTDVAHFRTDRSLYETLAYSGIGMLRYNFSAFGWPFAPLFIFFVARSRSRRMLWSLIVSFIVVHLWVLDPGIDIFGPHHYVELMLPMILLTVMGIRDLSRRLTLARRGKRGGCSQSATQDGWVVLPTVLALALIGVNLGTYLPVRMMTIARMTESINFPFTALQRSGVERAVVFAPRPFAMPCSSRPTKNLVFWRPNNDPDLTNDILWVNHISVAEDRKLMKHFPDRKGLVMMWDRQCKLSFFPVDQPAADVVPPARLAF